MKNKAMTFTILLALFLPFTYGGCGGDNDDDGDETQIGSKPQGLRIFVSSSLHHGDFANDPTLSGQTAVEKADDFCMQDANYPADDSIYKALLVDGLNRDAVTPTEWVLQPNTTYYRPSGFEIDTTNDDAIFTAFWREMKNSIGEDTGDAFQNAWTGIFDAGDFSTHQTSHCLGWSSSDIADIGDFGSYITKNGAAFSWPGDSSVCRNLLKLYCVEQP
jgi:L-fucose mutarotase/ribose pyranase (RbsD/FucU family)